MKKYIILSIVIFYTLTTNAQTTTTFENFGLDPESFLNGSDGSGGFTSGNMYFPNDYNSTYQSWTGWSISNTTDTTTPGFGNLYSAITGGGAEASDTYATTFVAGASYIALENEAACETVNGFFITNSTYAYLSMQDGDSFAKMFGGATGDDPDYFLLTIKKIKNGTLHADSVNFYLADFRFADNTQDYIVDEWTYVDLTVLGEADSLVFTLSSTDVGTYGMNTPALFCIDNAITSDGIVATSETFANTKLEAFPNPTTDILNIINIDPNSTCSVYNMQGAHMLSQKAETDHVALGVKHLPVGTYFVKVMNGKDSYTQLFVKH